MITVAVGPDSEWKSSGPAGHASERGVAPSGQQRQDRRAARRGDRLVDMVAQLGGRVDPHAVEHGGRDVVGRAGIVLGIGRRGIRGPVDEPALQAAAGHEQGVTLRPVVAAGVLVDLRSAAELARPDDQRLVEQAARLEVLDQGRQGLFGGRQEPLAEELKLSLCVSQPLMPGE